MNYDSTYDPKKDPLFAGMPTKVTTNAKLLRSIIWNNNIQPDNSSLNDFLKALTQSTMSEFKTLIDSGVSGPSAFIQLQQKLELQLLEINRYLGDDMR